MTFRVKYLSADEPLIYWDASLTTGPLIRGEPWLGGIPCGLWNQYLPWWRGVLHIPVVYETSHTHTGRGSGGARGTKRYQYSKDTLCLWKCTDRCLCPHFHFRTISAHTTCLKTSTWKGVLWRRRQHKTTDLKRKQYAYFIVHMHAQWTRWTAILTIAHTIISKDKHNLHYYPIACTAKLYHGVYSHSHTMTVMVHQEFMRIIVHSLLSANSCHPVWGAWKLFGFTRILPVQCRQIWNHQRHQSAGPNTHLTSQS